MKKNNLHKFISLILCLGIVLSGLAFSACGKTKSQKLTALYMPLDNRPINDLQVKLLAESLDIKLLVPDTEIYATALNGAKNGKGLQYGDRQAALEWLLKNADKADVLIIYLDQLLSGGLMNSRCMDTITDEFKVIDQLAELALKHKLYVIDSQLRLAASSGYLDFTQQDYEISRLYGKAERKALTPEELTLDNVIASYTTDASGGDALYSSGLTQEQIDYFTSPSASLSLQRMTAIRSRKLKLNAYAIEKLFNLENVSYFFGVDDSAAGFNIQGNEFAYLKKLTGGKLEKHSAIDCLGELALSCAYNDFLGNKPVSVSVEYFCANPEAELNYAGHTVSEAINQVLERCNAARVKADPEVAIIVAGNEDSETEAAYTSKALAKAIKDNQEKNIPTIYLDFASKVNQDILSEANIGMLLSAGLHANGSGASAIMGISQGLARYRALKYGEALSTQAQKAFVKDICFMFAKGYYWNSSYKQDMNNMIYGLNLDPNNMNGADKDQLKAINEGVTNKVNEASYAILNNLKGGKYISSLNPYTLSEIESVSIDSCSYPWMRTFEFTSELSVKLH